MFHPAILQKLRENSLEKIDNSKRSRRRGAFCITEKEIMEENLSKQ